MKNYLSGDERNVNVLLGLVYLTIEVYLQHKENFSDDEVKWLESTHTSLEEYMVALKNRVGDKEITRILRMVDTSKPVIKPRGDKSDNMYLVDKDTLEEIYRYAVEAYCFGCERQDFENCPLCRFMDRAGIGNSKEEPNKCTYWYAKE